MATPPLTMRDLRDFLLATLHHESPTVHAIPSKMSSPEFDFKTHDSAFKDRYLQLQNVRVRFIPTEKKDIRDMLYRFWSNIDRYAAPNQRRTIYDMHEEMCSFVGFRTDRVDRCRGEDALAWVALLAGSRVTKYLSWRDDEGGATCKDTPTLKSVMCRRAE
ncbi:hypothetical protein AHAS_Ahas02G0129400 [Arachis hypogaea]